MKYGFDNVINRRGTGSEKWDMCDEIFHGENLLPLWVADMDFQSPPEVIKALTERSAHGIFGYTAYTDSAYNSVIRWFSERHNWHIKKEWIMYSPGVVPALSILVQALTDPGDGVIIQRPVYHPFMHVVEGNGRRLLNSPLKQTSDGRFVMDFDDLKEKAADPSARMMLLCSPHNPPGRVWKRDELETLVSICAERDIIIVSDEIHCDLTYKGITHIPLPLVKPEYSDRIITCTAPSKTFNLAGLQLSNIIITDDKLRKKFRKAMMINGIIDPNSFAAAAMEAAYTHGGEWLDELMDYIKGNLEYMKSEFSLYLPQVRVVEPEGTYLVWTDFREFGLDYKELLRIFIEDAQVAPGQGNIYGPEGEGFMRFNLACPRAILEDGLDRIIRAFKNR